MDFLKRIKMIEGIKWDLAFDPISIDYGDRVHEKYYVEYLLIPVGGDLVVQKRYYVGKFVTLHEVMKIVYNFYNQKITNNEKGELKKFYPSIAKFHNYNRLSWGDIQMPYFVFMGLDKTYEKDCYQVVLESPYIGGVNSIPGRARVGPRYARNNIKGF